MSDKNQNKTPGWVNRIRQQPQLPEQVVFDKNEAWNKLFIQLETPEKKERKAWFWLAAAAVVTALLCAMVWMQFPEKTKPLVFQPLPHQKIQPRKLSEDLPKISGNNSVPIVPPVISTIPKKRKLPVISRPEKMELVLENIQASIMPQTSIQLPDIGAISLPENINMLPAAKDRKKPALVYLNEVESGNNSQFVLQKKSGRRYMNAPKFKPTEQDVLAASQSPLFSIKISSSN